MTPILSALLSLGLYLDQRIWAQAARPLRPSLKSDKGPLVPLGTSVTLTCRGPNESEMYILEKVQRLRRRITKKLQPPRTGAKFSIPSVTKNDAGNYSCFYTISSGLSEPSAPLDLVVTVPGVSKAHDHFQSPGDPQAMTSSVSNYTVSNIVCLSLAGLVLIILGVLLAEAWYSRKGP
ncbi:leukocyte immunoglobulin-like receptor subfamily A member 6 isoform X2 [Macrotis lagotis]|uniref:leukocyte immunoglobulin-like receptor subfamily A member 6 isoform X2 n=1 Tax=Macrotis lagotis TaxID=92651 RepID=UPI003D68C989